MDWNKRTSLETDAREIPHFEGRPNRERVIGEEDLLNLTILLNTETDFDTLLSKL